MGSEWTETSCLLGDIVNFSQGLQVPTNLQHVANKEGRVPFLRISDYTSSADERYIDAPENADRYWVNVEDVAMVRYGDTGKVGRNREGIIANNLFKITPSTDNVRRDYLYYYLSQQRVYEYIKAQTTSAGLPAINHRIASSIEFTYPPLPEQKAIAHILGTLDDKIELNRRMNATLEGMAQALFKSWFVDFDPVIDNALAAGNPIPDELAPRAEVRKNALESNDPSLSAEASAKAGFPAAFQFTEELGWIPEGWETLPVLSVCDLLGGSQPPASTFIDYPEDGYIRLLQIRDFSNDNHETYIPDNGKARRVEEDDILIGRYGSASGDRKKDSMGRVCRGKEGAYNVALMKLDPILACREYCLQLFDSDSFYNYLHGTGNKAVQSGFSKKELHNFRVCLPSEELRRNYEEFGQAVWNRMKQTSSETSALIKLRDTLLPKLISGELHIPEAEQLTKEALNV